MTEAAATIGHNRPPLVEFYREQNETLPDYLEGESADLLKRYDVLAAAFTRMPASVDDDEMDGKFTDFCNKQLASLKTALKGAHQNHKEPFLTGGRVVDAFYKRRIDEIEKWQDSARKRQTVYKTAKELAERRAREEAERVLREEAAAAQRVADEAAKALKDAATLDDAIRAEEIARASTAAAIEAARNAAVKAAELTRARGDQGGVSSLRSEWKGEITDRAALDLEMLRQFIPTDALDAALRGWIKANAPADHQAAPPVIAGARVYLHKFTR